MPNIQPDNLIPPDSELGQLLAQLSDDTDDKIWQIANICSDLIEEVAGGIVTRMDIYRAVAKRCKGRKINTIRRWTEVAHDFSPKLQKKYASLLSFEHFKTSRRLYQEGYTPSIEYGLQWCVEGNDHKITAGRFHTVGEMLNHFVPEFRVSKSAWGRAKEGLYDQFLLIDNDTDRNRLLEAWKTIEYVLDKKQVIG